MRLQQLNIIDPATREVVIDRIMALDPREVDLGRIRWVVLMALFNQPDKRAAFSDIHRVLAPGGRFAFTAFEVDPERVVDLPVLGVDPVPDYSTLLREVGFSVETYEQTSGWRERLAPDQLEAFEEVGAELLAELGYAREPAVAS